MKTYSGTKPLLLGIAVGGIAALTIGFVWGGWMTGTAAAQIANKQSEMAVTAALLPFCLQQSQQDLNATATLSSIKLAPSYERQVMLENTGWATMPGEEDPNKAVATACLKELSASF